ncbi:MAG: hypothetical protein A3G39_04515 [Deltaproteobacteria bacterium RIFCSPLOWO2_12_FULL_43_16]|nr:MAG: hypothetical protein A3D30_09530 [Deltaproteobacteria bacterium RIFCSPHIGHO2_02_FULL_43_33]OGQ61279.1 MAG: hypothetical protein A3G39_04515 [Deltaproteobacteria bacterium RIFCSPLOWO2_12_FULL_43_16]HBR16774.1 hypothetical protein [Deltaproteobacteria bacterium]
MQRYVFLKAFLALIALAVLCFLFRVLPGDMSWSKDGGCDNCHSGPKAKELGLDDIYAKIAALQFKHAVVEEEKCEQCHIIKGLKTGRTWEIVSPDAHKEQVFFLKDLSWDRKYKIDLKIRDNAGAEVLLSPVQFIPSQVANSVTKDQEAPFIKEAAVEEIKQAIFLEAAVKWETDKISNSIVEYGLTPQYGETAISDKVFVKEHKITLSGLKHSKQYHYRVLSRDIFGNIGVSNDFMLDTSIQINKIDAAKVIDKTRPVVKDVNIFRIKDAKDIYLKITSDRPIKAYLTANEPAEMDKHGFGLAPAGFSRINACVKCHSQGASHPVGIRSKGLKTTKIPAELPTIEGGMLTCVTCHYPHGGDKRYFARLDFQRDLCVACHTSAPYI